MSSVRSHRRSVISEAVAPWSDIARLLRGGDAGTLLPVIIPKHRRRLWWMLPLWLGVYALLSGVMLSLKESGSDGLGGMAAGALATLSYTFGVLLLVIGGLWWWRSSIVEIEQGTHGVLTRYGAVVRTLDAGRHYLWHPGRGSTSSSTRPPRSRIRRPSWPVPRRRTCRCAPSSSS